MKTQAKLNKFTAILLISIFASTTCNAAIYEVQITVTPPYPQADSLVTITVDVIDPDYGEEFNAASLNYWLDGVKYVCESEPLHSSIQTIETLTFTIGPFDKNDFIEYYVYLEFVYADNYQSNWYSITIGDKKVRTPLTQMQIIYIAVGSVVGFAVLTMIIVAIMRRRR